MHGFRFGVGFIHKKGWYIIVPTISYNMTFAYIKFKLPKIKPFQDLKKVELNVIMVIIMAMKLIFVTEYLHILLITSGRPLGKSVAV